ncbi:hypothetical protein DB31_3075 [Hyalangium minutum]|uniref:Uncharacterized protein n=1 Tax=Hyalangium minutum TaxID=394096 RepID=A0A085W5Q3_9BACT|nr:hypothetical protein DB31_3075 [Hyalangium minutum]
MFLRRTLPILKHLLDVRLSRTIQGASTPKGVRAPERP